MLERTFFVIINSASAIQYGHNLLARAYIISLSRDWSKHVT